MNALVTAATKGIGKAISLELARNHYNLAICARNAHDLKTFTLEITRQFPDVRVHALPVDCSDKEQLNAFANFVEQQVGEIDVLVNNAGMYLPGSILEEDEDDDDDGEYDDDEDGSYSDEYDDEGQEVVEDEPGKTPILPWLAQDEQ